MSFIVGLTGGIGSGKSTVADLFAGLGIEVVDADLIARELVAPGEPALADIAERFGAGILNADGSLDRRALRARVFEHPEHKDWLNGLLHPLIRERMLAACNAARSPYCLLVVPLLVENNLTELVQRVLVVDVDPKVQLTRTMARDQASEAQIKAIMAAQAGREQRLAAADDVLDNNTPDKNALIAAIEALHRQYLSLSAQHGRP